MSKTDRREILSRVAAGTISPEEAAAQLDGLQDEPSTEGIERVRIGRQFGSVDIVGDPTVRDAVAEGPHQARIDGDVMVIESEPDDGSGGFTFGFGVGRPFGIGIDKLLVRMNPKLALDLELQAGSCRVRGVTGPIKADVQAGSATIDGFESPLTLSVQAGSVRANGWLRDGSSTITCEAGSVGLHLERGSSVRITADSALGKVSLPGADTGKGRSTREAVVGGGLANLQIRTSMGSVTVSADA
ncbi:MAG TPA: hypothetical protein VII89_07910 [Candidatus Dormibacteraeota bacterium]